MSLSVVLIPTYNERENIKPIVSAIFAAHPELHILVIDDNSPDGTGDAVRELIKTYPNLSLLSRPKKEGLGAAYRHAISQVMSEGTVARIIMMDADGSHDVEYLTPMIMASEKFDVVIGSRYTSGGRITSWVLWRRILSRCGNLYARVLTGLPVKDMTSGFICIREDILKRLNLGTVGASGYAFLIDLKFHMIRELGASVKEIPILLRSRRGGESKISRHIIREGLITPLRLFSRRIFHTHTASNALRKEASGPMCHVCSSTATRFFCEKRGYRLYVCDMCEVMFVHPMPDDLSSIYTEEYFRNVEKQDSHGYTDYDKDKEPMRAAFVRSLGKIERATGGRKIFDVGAATGYFLDIARGRNWKTYGSEISAFGAGEARKRGHEMILGDISIMKDLPQVDAVTMWDVLEHVANPADFCQAINKMVPVGGIFLINTPDRMSVWARLLGPRWQLIVPPEHVHYYAPKNIRKLLGESGFEVLEISRMGKKFSLSYIFKMLWSWQKLKLWDIFARMTDNSFFRMFRIPINLRDNMFVLARKVHDI